MPATAAPTRLHLSLGSGCPARTIVSREETKKALEVTDRARYKIELMFGKDRRTAGLCSGLLSIWESGLRLHGGGDDKMYWCGYPKCGKPMASSNFAYAHVVCPSCQKEQFLDPKAKADHVQYLRREGKSLADIDKLPIVGGEKLFKLFPERIADLLVTTFNDLDRNADIYLKYSPLDMRYDKAHESVQDLKRLDVARMRREPVIYSRARIIQDLSSGADLRALFLAMIRA